MENQTSVHSENAARGRGGYERPQLVVFGDWRKLTLDPPRKSAALLGRGKCKEWEACDCVNQL